MADAFPLRWKTEFHSDKKKPSSVAAAVVFVSVVTVWCSNRNWAVNLKHLPALTANNANVCSALPWLTTLAVVHLFFPTVFCLFVRPATAVCFYPRSAGVCYSFGWEYTQLSLPRSVMSEPSGLIHELPWCHCQRPCKPYKDQTKTEDSEFPSAVLYFAPPPPPLMFLLFSLGEILPVYREMQRSGVSLADFPGKVFKEWGAELSISGSLMYLQLSFQLFPSLPPEGNPW